MAVTAAAVAVYVVVVDGECAVVAVAAGIVVVVACGGITNGTRSTIGNTHTLVTLTMDTTRVGQHENDISSSTVDNDNHDTKAHAFGNALPSENDSCE